VLRNPARTPSGKPLAVRLKDDKQSKIKHMATLKKKEIEKAITELVQYLNQHDIDPNDFQDNKGRMKSFKEFIYEKKFNEVIDKLLNGSYKEYFVETIVFEDKDEKPFLEQELILEWEQYKKIPKTNLTYRYDTGNTNTKTKDHIHVFAKNNQLYAINIDGSAHDGSTAKLGSKEIKFLKSIGFTPPKDGILEWIELENTKSYTALNIELLFD